MMISSGEPGTFEFRATFFGTFALQCNGENLTIPSSANTRSLLAFLLLNRRHQKTRDVLTGAFWPEMSEERARRALSQALWNIRRFIPGLIEASGETITISPHISLWIDVEEFERLTKPHLGAVTSSQNAQKDLERAILLYNGDFLEGNYDDWALLEREQRRLFLQQTLEILILLEKSSGDYKQALSNGLRLLQSDPLRESACREVMRLFHLSGNPEAALQEFTRFGRLLQEELGLEPDAETKALAQEIARRTDKVNAPYLPEPRVEYDSINFDHAQTMPLIGRKEERAELLRQIEGLTEQHGGLILLEGEAGVGKTRLLQEIARDAEWRGAQVLWGQTRETQSLQPYAPLVEALQAGLSPLRITQIHQMVERLWLQVIQPLLSIHAAGLPDIEPAPRLDPTQEKIRLVEAITQVLFGWARIVPLILIIEDLHWADQDTLKALPILTRRLIHCRILIICSYRGEDARANPQTWESLQVLDRGYLLERRILSRLGEPATGELIRRCLGLASPAPLFEERLFHETDGNPLFVLETLRALLDENLLTRDDEGRWSTPWDNTTTNYTELPLPRLVEKVIANRLKHLPKRLRRMLDVTAVLGNQFDFATLGAVSGLDILSVLEFTRELIRRSFLKETASGYRFEHDKIRQVIYGEIEARQRVHFHRLIATQIEVDNPAELSTLAYHFWQAEEWDKAAWYNQQAGEAALALYANQEARTYLTRALESLNQISGRDSRTQRASVVRAREIVNGRLSDRAAQKADLEALDQMLEDPDERISLALRWAEYYEALSDYSSAIQSARQAIELAEWEKDLSKKAAAQIVWGRALNMQADAEGSQAMLRDALQNSRLANDAQREATCLHSLARICFDHQNRYAEALEYCQQSLAAFRKLGNREGEANVLHLTCSILSDLGEVDRSIKQRLEVLRLRREMGDQRGEAMALYSLGISHRDVGDNAASFQYIHAATDISESIGDQRLEAYCRTYLGLLLEENDPSKSLCQYNRSLQIRRQIGQHALTVDTLAGLARASLQLGQIQQAKAYITEALDWVAQHGTFAVGDINLVYLAAYDIFNAANKTKQAQQIIQAAYKDLMFRAETIPDEANRHKFLEGLPQHERVIALYQGFHSRQKIVALPRAGNPAELIKVTWTVSTSKDEQIVGKVERRQHCLKRLLKEAREQGAEPDYKHLADALGAGLRTIERDMAALKQDSPAAKMAGDVP